MQAAYWSATRNCGPNGSSRAQSCPAVQTSISGWIRSRSATVRAPTRGGNPRARHVWSWPPSSQAAREASAAAARRCASASARRRPRSGASPRSATRCASCASSPASDPLRLERGARRPRVGTPGHSAGFDGHVSGILTGLRPGRADSSPCRLPRSWNHLGCRLWDRHVQLLRLLRRQDPGRPTESRTPNRQAGAR